LVAAGLAHLERNARVCRGEVAHDRGQDARADALVGPYTQTPGRARRQRGEVLGGSLQLGEHRLGVSQQRLTGLRQPDPPPTPGALDQPVPDDALQRRDLLADRRLRVAERCGGLWERALASDRAER